MGTEEGGEEGGGEGVGWVGGVVQKEGGEGGKVGTERVQKKG